jgi:hypothetical protein
MQIGAAAADRANGISNDIPRKSIVVHGRYRNTYQKSEIVLIAQQACQQQQPY